MATFKSGLKGQAVCVRDGFCVVNRIFGFAPFNCPPPPPPRCPQPDSKYHKSLNVTPSDFRGGTREGASWCWLPFLFFCLPRAGGWGTKAR